MNEDDYINSIEATVLLHTSMKQFCINESSSIYLEPGHLFRISFLINFVGLAINNHTFIIKVIPSDIGGVDGGSVCTIT